MDCISNWISRWQTQFGTGKCKIDLKQKKQTRECVLNGTIIQNADQEMEGRGRHKTEITAALCLWPILLLYKPIRKDAHVYYLRWELTLPYGNWQGLEIFNHLTSQFLKTPFRKHCNVFLISYAHFSSLFRLTHTTL